MSGRAGEEETSRRTQVVGRRSRKTQGHEGLRVAELNSRRPEEGQGPKEGL